MGGTRREPAGAEPQPEASREHEPARGAEHEPEAAGYRFQLLADREARWTESRYWKEFAVGHSWIRLISPEGEVDSWGYWPDLENGHAVDPSNPWKSIPGRVRHPDTAHVPNAIAAHDIDAEAAREVTEYGNAKEASPGRYNLFTYNCTTFACEMAAKAGVPIPSASTLGFKNPNDLYAGIKAKNADRGLDAMGQVPHADTPEQ